MALIIQTYVIQMGTDFAATEEGRQYFAIEEAEHIMNSLHLGLREMLKTGNEQEAQEAWVMVCNLRIIPYLRH